MTDGHQVLRTLAAVVAAAALVFIGIQEKQQTDIACREYVTEYFARDCE